MTVLSGFSRLKGLFSSSMNFTTYKEIVEASKSAECGNIPKDIIGILLGKGSLGTVQTDITTAKDAFAAASDVLAQGVNVSQRAQAIHIHRMFGSAFDKEKIISLDFLRGFDAKKAALNLSSCTRGIEDASKALTESFSRIIPNCAKVEVKPLKFGSFGQGYKLEFLDANGEKLVHDKVLKVFYDQSKSQALLFEEIMPVIVQRSKEFTPRDIVRFFNNIKNIKAEEVMKFLKPYEEELAKQGITITPEKVEEALAKLRSLKLKDIKPFFAGFQDFSKAGGQFVKAMQAQISTQHGVYAEANAMIYLRNRLGHSLSKTNVVAPDYYNLKKGFSVAEFSDDLLPASKTDVNFEALGLHHSDLREGNKVGGRIIDLGGLNLQVPELSDKITARYYKKIMNQGNPEQRSKYILQLKTEMEKMNDLDRGKVQKAIDLSA